MRHRLLGDTVGQPLFGRTRRAGRRTRQSGRLISSRPTRSGSRPRRRIHSCGGRHRRREGGSRRSPPGRRRGRVDWDRIAGDLTDLATGRLHRKDDSEITLFKSVGLAVQDLAIAQRAAAAAGISRAHEQECRDHRWRIGRLVVGVVPHRGRRGSDHHRQRELGVARRGQRRLHVHCHRRALAGTRRDRQRAEVLARPGTGIARATQGDPADGTLAACVRPQLHASRYQSGRARARPVQPQQLGRPRTSGCPGCRCLAEPRTLVPYHDVAKAEHHFAALQPMVEFGARVPDRVVDGDELRRLAPAITDHVAGRPGDAGRSLDRSSPLCRLGHRDPHRTERPVHRAHRDRHGDSVDDRVRSIYDSNGTVIDGEEFVLAPVRDHGWSPSTSICNFR